MGEVVANIQVTSFEKLDVPEFTGSITYDVLKHGSLQELITRIPNGTYIELPEGNYFEDITINKIIYLKGIGDVNIYGCGGQHSTIISQSHYLLIDGINVYGFAENRGGNAIHVESGYSCLVDCAFYGFKMAAVRIEKALVEMHNCLGSSDMNSPCISLLHGSQLYAEKSILANSYSGLKIDQSSVTVIGCRVKNNKVGVEFVKSSSAIVQFSIFDDNITTVASNETGNSVFSNCVITNKGNAFTYIKDESNLAFVQCSIKRTGNETAQFPKFFIIVKSHVSFINSEIDCMGYNDSQMLSREGTLLFKNSKIIDFAQGFSMQESQFTADNLTLECSTMSSGNGITDLKSSFNVTNLTVHNYTLPLVLVQTKGQIAQSKFNDIINQGIQVSGCELTFAESSFNNAREKLGFKIINNSNIGFSQCNFQDSVERFIFVTGGSTSTFSECKFTKSDTAITAIGAKLSLLNSTFEECKTAVNASQSILTIQGSTIKNSDRGITLSKQTQAVIQNSYIIECSTVGILAFEVQCKLVSCQIFGCHLSVQAQNSVFVAQQCDVGSSQMHGISIVASQSHIEGCLIHDNAKTGIVGQTGTTLNLVGSVVSSSGSTGAIFNENCTATVANCQFAGNQGPSIMVGQGCQLTLKNSMMQDPLAVHRMPGSTFIDEGNQFEGTSEKVG